MSAPEVEVLRGNPTQAEERAIRQAIISVWRQDAATATATATAPAPSGGWLRAARAEASNPAAQKTWKTALGLTQGTGTHSARRVGRGDQR